MSDSFSRQYSKTEWEAKNPPLLAGVRGLERDTGREKLGDGVTRWNQLPYLDVVKRKVEPSAVTSINGMTGDVKLTADNIHGTFNDYQIPSSVARDTEVARMVREATEETG